MEFSGHRGRPLQVTNSVNDEQAVRAVQSSHSLLAESRNVLRVCAQGPPASA
jgi:hypothetical protein